ncbi:hypothetical protein M9H77_28749 [Catharanthus roseus]|uniref:Uncharacterized protein n=1 Tax=Catharanthus roseus TaxID=4058 RepID=A0ACC0AKD1_CATRO|nr:hypothetical protein M9H77_28749 [Catharanthus roseus]
MTTILSAEFFPQPLPCTNSSKPNSQSTNKSLVRCRNERKSRSPQRVKVCTENRSTQLQSNDSAEPNFVKLLNRSCKAGKFSEALYFLENMVNRGSHKPDVILCTKLIKGLFSSKQMEKALRVLKILEVYGEPDVFAYNAVISGFCKGNQIDSANEMLNRMRARGISPDIVTYNIMIGSLCNRGKLGLAQKVFDELLEDNCKPTVVTYTILIEATILEGGIRKAMKLLDEMLSKGLQPDMYTYNTIIRGLCREGMMDRAYEFISSLPEKGWKPDVISYNILLRSLLSEGKWRDGKKLVAEMLSTGSEPNVVTYSILVTALCRDGKLEEAVNLLKLMMDKGLTPDTFTYEPVISAFCREGKIDLAITFLDYMISSGCLPDIVNYNTILSAMCKNGKADQALEVFDKLDELGSHRIDDAIEILEEMVKKGCRPNETTYVLLVEGIGFAGWRAEAMKAASSLLKKNVISRESFRRLKRTFPALDVTKDVAYTETSK